MGLVWRHLFLMTRPQRGPSDDDKSLFDGGVAASYETET